MMGTEADEGYAPDEPAWPLMTFTLVAICSITFIILWISGLIASAEKGAFVVESLYALPNDNELLQRFGALELTRVWLDGEWWRLATAPFLHGSWLHLVLNMVALASIGLWVEHIWGKCCTFVLFFIASLAGCLASLLWAEAAIVVGASGGIMGMAGALWVARSYGPPELKRRLDPISARQLGIMLAVVLALGAFIPMIAQAGHIGGLAPGILIGLGVAFARPRLGWVGALVTPLLMMPFARAPEWRANYHKFSGFRLLEDRQSKRALAAFERALASQPNDAGMANAVAYELALAGAEYERGLELVDQALAVEPENPDFLDTRGWILCRQGRVEEGQRWLARAVENSETPNDEILGHVEQCSDAVKSSPTS